jgi:hypothetical protein
MEHQENTQPINISLNVLGYQEEGEWVALALEMDLRGYGETFKDAFADLEDLVIMQISFSRFKGQPELIWKAAEPIWFDRFAEARRDYLNSLITDEKEVDPEYSVAGLPIPPAHVIAAMNNGFVQSDPTA